MVRNAKTGEGAVYETFLFCHAVRLEVHARPLQRISLRVTQSQRDSLTMPLEPCARNFQLASFPTAAEFGSPTGWRQVRRVRPAYGGPFKIDEMRLKERAQAESRRAGGEASEQSRHDARRYSSRRSSTTTPRSRLLHIVECSGCSSAPACEQPFHATNVLAETGPRSPIRQSSSAKRYLGRRDLTSCMSRFITQIGRAHV